MSTLLLAGLFVLLLWIGWNLSTLVYLFRRFLLQLDPNGEKRTVFDQIRDSVRDLILK